MTRIKLKIRVQMHGLSFPSHRLFVWSTLLHWSFLAPVRKLGVNPVTVQLHNIVVRNQITRTCLADRIKE